jgi:thioredoxin-like negative regulator of GroEL
MIVFKGGQPAQQIIGYRPKNELKKVLDEVLGE